MTATTPGPRFRDQLAEVLADHEPIYHSGHDGDPDWFACGRDGEATCDWTSDWESDDVGSDHRAHVASLIAAHVQAEVQAATDRARQDGVEAGRGDMAALEARWRAEERAAGNQRAAEADYRPCAGCDQPCGCPLTAPGEAGR